MSTGLDYAFYPHPSVTAIKAYGASFVVRYTSPIVSNDTNGKNLIPSELKTLLGAGLKVCVVFESSKNRMLGGQAAGVEDATHTAAVLSALGLDGLPAYFACDWDATPGQQAAINAYLDGAASVIGRSRVGIYGGYYPVKRALDAGKAAYAWQTYAWSGGQWDSRAQLRQTKNGITVGGADCDRDESRATDFAQWPRPSADTRYVVPEGNVLTLWGLARENSTTVEQIVYVSRKYLSAAHDAILTNYLALAAALTDDANPRPVMPVGMVVWLP